MHLFQDCLYVLRKGVVFQDIKRPAHWSKKTTAQLPLVVRNCIYGVIIKSQTDSQTGLESWQARLVADTKTMF